MIQQVADARAEGAELTAILQPLSDADYERVTAFKGYTINDVLRHLHQGDHMGVLSATDPEKFRDWYKGRTQRRASGVSSRDDARLEYGHLAGRALLEAWQARLDHLCTLLDAKGPDARLVWSGPDMGVRMFATARQMEIWAHGQEIHDVLGLERAPTDRLKNIATIGVRTFGSTSSTGNERCLQRCPISGSTLRPVVHGSGTSRRRPMRSPAPRSTSARS